MNKIDQYLCSLISFGCFLFPEYHFMVMESHIYFGYLQGLNIGIIYQGGGTLFFI